MSSPPLFNKRKRDKSSIARKASAIDLQQPSSRDASEEQESSAAMGSASKHKKPASSGDPPAKRTRTRTRSNAPSAEALAGNGEIPTIQKEDPGEPSDTTEASEDIANNSKLNKTTAQSHTDAREIMAPPVTGRLKDPKGYHTNPPPQDRAVRVYADGVFDLFHLGHMRQLEQAKKAFPDTYLIVGVAGDGETHKRKGLTVLTGAERAETVRHCKWVDEVLPDCPWIVTPEFLAEHKIDYVAHDDEPYGAAEGDDIYAPIKKKGQFLVTERTEGVSTTGIITKIVRDYEKYISRQFKRGTTRQELNVSWLKKNELDFKRNMNEIRDNIKTNWSTTGQELTKELRQFWQNSRPGSPARGVSPRPGDVETTSGMRSPTAYAHLSHLDIPKTGANHDFATGFTLGLIGGVRSWMTRSQVSLRSTGTGPNSPSGSDDDGSDGDKSPRSEGDAPRGRTRQQEKEADAMEA